MKNGIFKYVNPKLFITTTVIGYTLFGWVITWLSEFTNKLESPYVHYPTAGVLLVFLYVWIDTKGWNKKPFSWLYWSEDISGRYVGEIDYIHPINGNPETKRCVVEIEQTGSRLTVNSYFQKPKGQEPTRSVSLMTALSIDEHKNLSVIYNYRNEGNPTMKFPSHLGTNVLQVIKGAGENGYSLKGPYFTDREPQTKGNLIVNFESKILKREF